MVRRIALACHFTPSRVVSHANDSGGHASQARTSG